MHIARATRARAREDQACITNVADSLKHRQIFKSKSRRRKNHAHESNGPFKHIEQVVGFGAQAYVMKVTRFAATSEAKLHC